MNTTVNHIAIKLQNVPYSVVWAFRLFFFYTIYFTLSIRNTAAQATEMKYLSGTGSDQTVSWQFYCTDGMNAGKWSGIAVPSCWELQGFGKYDYGHAKDSVRGREKGLYKHEFTIPTAWKNKVVNLVFEGVMTDAEVKINGRSAGPVHQGAFYAFKYDISSLLNYAGSNLLEVTVAKHSSNESVNAAERRADYWIFGGIFRPVYLEALPPQRITQVSIDAKANGQFTARVLVRGIQANEVTARVSHSGMKQVVAISRKVDATDTLVTLQHNLVYVKQWTPEAPHLYTVTIALKKDGKTLHTVSKKFGFRTVEVKPRDGIYVNGVKVKMKGVNRHSFYPTSGRTTSRKLSVEHVLMMKDMNMNAVRMSHYPPDDHFLDACDSLGLFVIDELAGWHGHYDTPTGAPLVKAMIDHDVNHPSIIMWANGNEGGHNFELDRLFDMYDIQKRPVIHPWELFGGIETQHYREYNYGIGNYNAGREIVMPTEFLHGWYDGGHGAGLEDYWEKMWHDPLSAGGFLWDLADEGVVRRDLNDSVDTDRFRGADGIVGPFHEKEASYFTIKEVWSPVYFERKEITSGFDGSFAVQNRYFYTNLADCRFSWSLKSFGRNPAERKGFLTAPDVPPGQKGVLRMQLPQQWNQYDVLFVTVTGKDGKEIFTWSFPIIKPIDIAKKQVGLAGAKAVVREQDSVFVVTAGGVTVQIHKQNGRLLRVSNAKGLIPISDGPVIQEGVNNFSAFTSHFEQDTLVIASFFDRKKNFNTLHWKIYPSGVIRMEVKYFPEAYFTWFDGVNFSFPEKQMTAVEYMGNGPYRVWKNRLRGNRFGVWKKEYNDTETAESWRYPEFKGYHSNLYWCRLFTANQQFTVLTENEDLFLRLFTPAFKTDQWHNYEPIFPAGDISFMQGIASIGSKTQRAETTGPMGMKNIFYDYEKDPARALRIVLYFDFRANQ